VRALEAAPAAPQVAEVRGLNRTLEGKLDASLKGELELVDRVVRLEADRAALEELAVALRQQREREREQRERELEEQRGGGEAAARAAEAQVWECREALIYT
jgi:hypothetical protein